MGAYRFSLPGCLSQKQIVTASCAGNCGTFLLKICAATVAGANARSPWLQILLTLISGVMRCVAAAMKEGGAWLRLGLECAFCLPGNEDELAIFLLESGVRSLKHLQFEDHPREWPGACYREEDRVGGRLGPEGSERKV